MSVGREAQAGGRNAAAFVLATVLINAIGIGIILPVMPDLIRDLTGLGISGAAFWGGFVTMAYAAMQFLLSPTVGNLSDRFGRRPVLLVSLATLAVDYAVMAFAPSLWVLFVGRLVSGAAGATMATANAFMADISPPERRAQNFAMVGASFGVGFIIGPMINEYPFDKPDVLSRLQGPSREHWFGTDEIGRDLFVRTARGGRYSLAIGLLSAITATAIGTLIGSVAGYFGRAVDALIAQLINLFLVVPALIVLSVFALNFGSNWWRLSIVLAGLLWVRIARVARGVVLSIKEQEYVMAARAAGASHLRIITRHILPNVVGAVTVEITLLLGSVIVLESTLSFLGLGVRPPDTSLGRLVADAKGNIDNDPLRVLTPGLVIVLIVLCVNFLGDGLRDALDPRARSERAGSDD